MTSATQPPLSGILVLDVSRLLPGAVLARTLIDLGARLIKIEDPRFGDPLRNTPPPCHGTSAAFAAFLRGSESVCFDLGSSEGGRALRKLARHADVLVESFRPGTMARWGLDSARLRAANPGLVTCSLSGYGLTGERARMVGHDLNLTASSGLLSLLPEQEGRIPQIQMADVTSAVLASTAIVAALLRRARTGRGVDIDQPLATGVLPIVTWAFADESAGGGGLNEHVLAGDCPCYRVYRCQGGAAIAAGTLEPKFWVGFCEMLDLHEHKGAGLDGGERGRRAIAAVEQALSRKPREHWLELGRERGLPLSPVDDLASARAPGGFFQLTGLTEQTPAGEGRTLMTPAPYIPSLGSTPERPAPRLGEHTEAVCEEFGIELS